MTILGLLFAVCVIVFLLWVTREFMPAPFKTPVLVFLVLLGIAWVLSQVWPGLASARLGR